MFSMIFTVFSKEMKTFLRDKRSLAIMILVPLLMYPAIVLLMSEFSQRRQVSEDIPGIHISGLEQGSIMHEIINSEEDFSLATEEDAVVILHFNEDPFLGLANDGQATTVDIIGHTQTAEDIIDRANKILTSAMLKNAGLPLSIGEPIKIGIVKESGHPGMLVMAATALPGLVIIMLAIGASMSTQKLTAGERELETIETLFSSSAKPSELAIGKFCAIALTSIATASINLLSCTVTFSYIISAAQSTKNLELDIAWAQIALIAPALLACSLLISALFMVVSSRAKTVIESGHRLIPTMLLLSFPALLAGIPGSGEDSLMRCIPLINFNLLMKDALLGELLIVNTIITIASTLVGTTILLWALVNLWSQDDFVRPTESDISMPLLRASIKPHILPTKTEGWALFFFLLITHMVIGTWLQTKNLFIGGLINFWVIIAGGTLLFLWWRRVNIKKSISPAKNSWKAIALAPLLVLLAIPIIQYFSWALSALGLSGAESAALGQAIKGIIDDRGIFAALFFLAITPAICEELLFRGAIMSSFRKFMKPSHAVVLTALLFGIMHLSLFRLPATTLLGVIMGILAWRHGILAAMTFHAFFNGFQVLAIALDKNHWFVNCYEIIGSSAVIAIIGSGALAIFAIKTFKNNNKGRPTNIRNLFLLKNNQ